MGRFFATAFSSVMKLNLKFVHYNIYLINYSFLYETISLRDEFISKVHRGARRTVKST